MRTLINRVVYKVKNGGWVNKVECTDEPSSVHYTRLAAVVSAKMMLRQEGGGTLIIRDLTGAVTDRIKVRPDNITSVVKIKGGYNSSG